MWIIQAARAGSDEFIDKSPRCVITQDAVCAAADNVQIAVWSKECPERFIEAARKLKSDKSGEAFERALKKITSPKQ